MKETTYEVFNWDKDGNLIDHETYTCAWDLLKDWPYSQKEIDVAITRGPGQIEWTTVDAVAQEFKDND